VRVEGVARLDPIELEIQPDLTAQFGQVFVTGAYLLGAHAVLGRQEFIHGLRAASRCTGVQLEGAVDDLYLATVRELLTCDIEPAHPEGAPRTRKIRPNLYLHT